MGSDPFLGPGIVPTEVKVAFVEALADAGLGVVETTAFVSPRAIPQLADSAEVFSRVRKRGRKTVVKIRSPNVKRRSGMTFIM